MRWHLRDTSRLREVKVLGDHCVALASENYWEWLSNLLHRLNLVNLGAPALRSLEMMPPSRSTRFTMADFLPLVGALSQLESLVLSNWRYITADIAAIPHLTRLQNLKVSLSDRQDDGSANENANCPTFLCGVVPENLQSKQPLCFVWWTTNVTSPSIQYLYRYLIHAMTF